MRYKRLTALILSAFMLTSLTACNNTSNNTATESSAETISSAPETVSENDTSDNTNHQAESDMTTNSNDTSTDTQANKTLVLYFSAGNSTADTISSATPYENGYYSTQQLAVWIHDEVGGDLVALTPTNAYPLGYNETADQAKQEADNNTRPPFEDLGVNIDDYQTIYIGYPIWWYTVPMIVNTFFDTYDCSGKTIIPFNAHAGSGNGGTYDTIRSLEPNATVLDGLAIRGTSSFDDSTKQQIKDWLASLQ